MMSNTRRAIALERRRLTSLRSTWTCSITALIVAGLGSAITSALARDIQSEGNTSAGIDAATLGLALTTLAGATPVAVIPLFCWIVGALASTQEYRHNTITATLLAFPRRDDVLIGKSSVIAIYSAIVAASAVIVAGVASAFIPGAIGALTTDVPTILGSVAVALIVALLYGVWGLAIGGATRSFTTTTVVLLVLPLIGESAIKQLLLSIGAPAGVAGGRWLPFTAAQNLAALPLDGVLPQWWWGTPIVCAAWTIVAVIAWRWRIRR